MGDILHEIGLIGTYPPPYGGVSVHIKELGEFLEKSGLCCVYFNTGKSKDINRPDVINVMSLKDLCSKLISSKADLLHVHGGVELYKKLLVFWAVRCLTGKLFVITVHSGGIVSDLENKNVFSRALIALLFRHAEKIICVSERIKCTIVRLGIAEHKCPVIPAFAINKSLKFVKIPLGLKEFVQGKRPLISCVGFCFAPYYGFELAIEAVNILQAKFPNIGLVIMGGDKDDEEYRSLIKKFSEEQLGAVHFSGDIRHKAVLSVMSRCDLFLRPTYHDGDSNSVREAIAMELPVIASDTEVRPEEAILFRKGDIGDLSDKILQTINTRNIMPKKKQEKIVHLENLEAILDAYRGICQ